MKSSQPLARPPRLTLACIGLVLTLSACIRTPPPILPAWQCFTPMVEASGLGKETPHASFPAAAEAGHWVDFGNREAGQLDKANAEKAGIVGIGRKCDEWAETATKQSRRKKILGLF